MKRTHSMMSLLVAGALACAAPLALAQSSSDAQDSGLQHPQSGALTHSGNLQEYPKQSATESGTSQQIGGSEQAGRTQRSGSANMSATSTSSEQLMGEHSMSGTVESVGSDGVVKVKSDGMNLLLHFPHAAQNLKKGDKITVHLGYTKDSSAPSSASSSM